MNSNTGTPNHHTYSFPTAVMIVILGIFFTILVCVSIVVSYPVVRLFDRRLGLLNTYAIIWARSTIGILPKSGYVIKGTEHIPPKGKPVIYVANHSSQTDILALFLLGQPFRFIAKKSLFKVPLFGWALWALGYVAVDRQSVASRKLSVQQSRKVLKEGNSMLFFPEGGRSKDGQLKPFKMGAFSVAKETGVDIVPITLLGTGTLLPKGSMRPHRTNITIVVHPTIATQNLSVAEIATRASTAIASALPPPTVQAPSTSPTATTVEAPA
jgi:1-acyl-sn-glycerol-3-phosphate acyltransferase